jgi:hypothetical protein
MAENKFFPTANEIIDAYQHVKNEIERQKYERARASQRLLADQQSHCYLCDNSGYCSYAKNGYEYVARCICAHGKDLNKFSRAQIDRDRVPEIKDCYNASDKDKINSGRNPFYLPNIREATGDGFPVYDARKKERYLSKAGANDKDRAGILRKMAGIGGAG